MNAILKCLGFLCSKAYSLGWMYKSSIICESLGGEKKRTIGSPFQISGLNNIVTEEPINQYWCEFHNIHNQSKIGNKEAFCFRTKFNYHNWRPPLYGWKILGHNPR